MVKIDLKGQIKEFEQGVTAADVAKSIGMGLYKSACAAKIDGQVCDLRTPIERDCSLEILTFDTAEGKHAYWHTTSHIMAQAVMRLYPGTKFSIGPAIENGFYYDFDLEQPLSTEDLPAIEEEMKKIIKENLPLERFELPPEEAEKLMADQPYKEELIAEHAGKGENITGGLVGALLGSLVGVVSIIIFSQLGYVAALSGVIMAVCTLKGYEMLGGNLSRKGVALCVVFMLAMTFVGDRLDWAILVSRELGYSFLTSFRLIPALIEADIIEASSYWTNLVMLYLFLLLGMVPTVRNSLVSRANASRIYRLEKSGTRM